MSKDPRLSIRITAELEAWLENEAAARGLDKTAFARMMLFERMNGRAAAPAVTYSAVERALDALPDGYVPFDPSRDYADREALPPTDPEDLEAIIERRVAERLAASSSRADTYAEGQTGMHAHRRGLLPEYGGVAPGGVAFRIQRHPVFGA